MCYPDKEFLMWSKRSNCNQGHCNTDDLYWLICQNKFSTE